MGAFDDLIPTNAPGVGAFDDLIPARTGAFDDLLPDGSSLQNDAARAVPSRLSTIAGRSPLKAPAELPVIEADAELLERVVPSEKELAAQAQAASKKRAMDDRMRVVEEIQSWTPEKAIARLGLSIAEAGGELRRIEGGLLGALPLGFLDPILKPLTGETKQEAARRIARQGREISNRYSKLGADVGGGPALDIPAELSKTALVSAPALPVAAVAGLPAAATAAGLQSTGATFDEAVEAFKGEGASQEEAERRAIGPAYVSGAITTAITAGFGRTGAEAVTRKFTQAEASNIVGTVLKQAGLEGVEEASDEIGQNILATLTYDPKRTVDDAVRSSLFAFAAGAGLGGGMTAGHAAVDRLQGRKAEPAPRKVEVTRDLAAELQSAMQGNQVVEKPAPTADDLLQAVLSDLPREVRSDIEARLEEEKNAKTSAKESQVAPNESGTIVPEAVSNDTETESDLQEQLAAEMEGLTADLDDETNTAGAAAETITGQNEQKGSDAAAAATSAAEQMPAEVTPAKADTLTPRPTSPPVQPKQKSPFFIRPRSDGVPDILDDIQFLGGIRPPGEYSGGEYDGFREAMVGPARVLVRQAAAHRPDTLIRELRAIGAVGAERLETVDDLWDAIRAAVKNREALRKREMAQTEKGRQHREFQRRAVAGQRPKGERTERIPVDAMLIGDTFKVQDHSFEVKHLEFDEDGRLVFVEVKDGPKFGVQRIGPDEAEFIHVDRNTFEEGPEHDGFSVPRPEPPVPPSNSEIGGETKGPPLELHEDAPIYSSGNNATQRVNEVSGRKQTDDRSGRNADRPRNQAGESGSAQQPGAVQQAGPKAASREALAEEIYRNSYANLSDEAQANVRRLIKDGRKASTKQPTQIDERLLAMQDEVFRLREELFHAPRDKHNFPQTTRGIGLLAQIRHLEWQIDMLREIASASADLKQEWFRKFLEGDAPDAVERTLDRWIKWTSDGQGTLLEGVTGAPVWLTKSALNGALKVIRAAYQGGKKLAAAIEDGVAWLREQKLQDFNENQAREFLTEAARNANPVIQRLPDEKAARQARIEAVVNELMAAQEERAKHRSTFQRIPDELVRRMRDLEAELRELKGWAAPEAASVETQPATKPFTPRKPREQIKHRSGPRPDFGARAPETKLKLDRLMKEAAAAQAEAKTSGDWSRVRDLNDQINDLINAPDPTSGRVNVDMPRSTEETSEMIAATAEALNGALASEQAHRSVGEPISGDLTQLVNDLKTRLELLKGWANDAAEAAAAGERVAKPLELPATERQRQLELEGATNPEGTDFNTFWEGLKRGLRYLLSPVPEIPILGEAATKAAVFLRGYRLFAAETNRVKREAGEKIQNVLEPLEKLGRTRAQNDALKNFQRLSLALQQARARQDDKAADAIAEKMDRLEKAGLANDPFNLFRKIVLYRDIWWRASFLKTPDGKPITLPNGLTIEEVAAELRRLNARLAAHPDREAIREALQRHYALTNELQQSILDHGEIIPEALRNPLYFPHHILENWTGNMDRVRPSTEEDFRRYLIAPVGSGKLIQSDYLKAMYLHVADVMAHNARVDLVQKYWQAYDISEKLKKEHGEAWDKPWNVPPGYRLFAPFKKLPLRMDYILSRETLAEKLGVLFNDGDLRERLGESGKVLKVSPEDLHAALVAGEKIKWALPIEIADALDGISKREAAKSNPGLGHDLGLPARKLVNFWKKTKLFAPWNWIRYEYGNTLTDVVDKVLVADPKIAAYLKQAATEILTASWKGEKSEPFKAASREGVFETITAAEVGELQRLREFSAFQSSEEKAKSIVRRFLEATTGASRFREAVFRYAKFLADVDRMKAGQEPVYAGAYHESIRALGEGLDGQQPLLEGDELLYAKAAEISLKTFGDYNSLAVFSQWLRTYLVPFWSWQDVNFRYHANQLRNIADGLRGIRGGSARQVALKYAAVRVISVLAGVGIAQELWNQFGGPMMGLWDDDDDLENQLSAQDRRRSHVLLGKDRNGKAMVVYTPSAFADVAEWIGGQNAKRLFIEYARGDITLEQFVSDYAKQLPPDVLNKLAQSGGPLLKAPYEAISGKSVFPDVTDQRTIPKSERVWRFVGSMTDDRAVNWLRQAFDKDHYAQPANEQLQQIVLQVRRRDPEQWAYYETRDKAADWKERKTGKRSEFGSYDAPEAQVLRNFRKAIYRADVDDAERFYRRLLDYGYTAERLDASIRNQHPLSDLKKEERQEYLAGLNARDRRLLELATRYYEKLAALDKRERRLFPTERQVKHGVKREPNTELLREIVGR